MEFEVKRIADMNRAAYNPRVDLQPEDEEYQAIERSLKRHGLVQPIVWNRRTNTVVSGHQRLTVLEAQGETEVTVSVVDLDDIQEKELRLAENLKQNCIPDGFESMEIGDYQDFLQRRRELMAEKIHQYYDSL